MFYCGAMENAERNLFQGQRLRARGAASRQTGRFEVQSRVAFDVGWQIEETDRLVKTKVRLEVLRSALTYNRSPDLPFDRAVNPYCGCEHGCVDCFARPSHAIFEPVAGFGFRDTGDCKAGDRGGVGPGIVQSQL